MPEVNHPHEENAMYAALSARRHLIGVGLLCCMLLALPALLAVSVFALCPPLRPVYWMGAVIVLAGALVIVGDYLIQRYLERVSAWLNGTAAAVRREAKRQWDYTVREDLQAALYFTARDIVARTGRARRRAGEWLDASVREPLRVYLVTVGREVAVEASHARHTFGEWLAKLTKPQPKLTCGATPYEIMARMSVCPEAAAATRAVETPADDVSHIDSAAFCILCGSDPCVCQHIGRDLPDDESTFRAVFSTDDVITDRVRRADARRRGRVARRHQLARSMEGAAWGGSSNAPGAANATESSTANAPCASPAGTAATCRR